MHTDHDRESLGRVALAILAVVAYVCIVAGCGGSAYDRARTTVATTARVVAAADAVAADVVRERIESAETPEQLEREDRRAERVTRAFVTTHAALLAADSALDAWAAGSADEGSWLDAVSCALPALMGLADVLAEYGVSEAVTEPLRMAVGALSGFLGGECRAP